MTELIYYLSSQQNYVLLELLPEIGKVITNYSSTLLN